MTPADYQFLQKFLKDRSGLDLYADKQYLIDSRLSPIVRKTGLAGLGDLVQAVRAGDETIAKQVVEAMTTNETFFFRDKVPFDHFREAILPALLRRARPAAGRATGARRVRRAGAVTRSRCA